LSLHLGALDQTHDRSTSLARLNLTRKLPIIQGFGEFLPPLELTLNFLELMNKLQWFFTYWACVAPMQIKEFTSCKDHASHLRHSSIKVTF
jgi:hypothetical protein